MDTKLKQELDKGLTDKGLAQSSIKLYLRNLEKLNDNQPIKNLNFLKDPAVIQERLVKYRENTKRGYLISICSVLSLDKSTKAKQKLYDEYFKLMMDKNKELKGEEKENVKSETQEKNWMDWKEVEEKYDELEKKVNAFKDQKTLNEHQYNTLLQYVVLSLYVLFPPRRNEFQKVMVAKSATEKSPTDTNWLDLDRTRFIFNKYKTSKKEGVAIIDMPEAFVRVLSRYMKFHPLTKGKKITNKTEPFPFLVHYDGKPLDKVNSITRVLNKVFGKKAGSSMLRASYLTGKYGDVRQEMKDDAKAMSHSVATQQTNYVKK
jgi:integrase